MRTSNYPSPGLGQLLASWFAFTEPIIFALAARAQGLTDDTSETVKDTLLDLGAGPSEESAAGRSGTQPLPPLDAEELAAVLREEVERVLRRAAEVINEDPYGCW